MAFAELLAKPRGIDALGVETEVTIIGAGIAGLTAARDLTRQGITVSIVEALPRIGGRILTVKKDGRNYDLGASWFHEIGYNELYTIAKERNWDLHFDDGKVVFFNADGTALSDSEMEETLKHELTLKDLDNTVSLKDASPNHPSVRAYEHWMGIPWNQIPAQQVGSYAAQLSFSNRQEDYRDAFNRSGNSSVVDYILEGIDWKYGKLYLNSATTKINKGDKYTVYTANGYNFTSKAVICTIPLGALRSNFDNLFSSLTIPPKLRKAISEGVMAALGKVVLEFDTQFWDSSIDRCDVLTDPPVFMTFPHRNTTGPPTLIALTAPPLTNLIEKNPEKAFQLLTPALRVLSAGKSVPTPSSVICTDWTTNPYFRGSYSAVKVGQTEEEFAEPFADGAGNLRFAGEHTSLHGIGCMHGAYASGIREANYLIKLLIKRSKL